MNGGKNLYLKGICIEGNKRNANERVYPLHEITKAVNTINKQISEGYSVLGEVDHPDDLKINLDRVCHSVEEMWMDGTAGCGKLKILPTPMGNLIKTLLQSGVKLGVSSRGSGNVDDRTGHVSDFEQRHFAPRGPFEVIQSVDQMRWGALQVARAHRLIQSVQATT